MSPGGIADLIVVVADLRADADLNTVAGNSSGAMVSLYD
jgi:hypothetical protein